MKNKRTRLGRPSGVSVGRCGPWTIYKTGDDRYKLCSSERIDGKANYVFAVRNGNVLTNPDLDVSKLKEDHPKLFDTLVAFFQRFQGPEDLAEYHQEQQQDDKYGDLAVTQRREFTPDQMFHRSMLAMRRHELEWVATDKAPQRFWEKGVRLAWEGAYRSEISLDRLEAGIAWIVSRTAPAIDMATLLAVEKAYYDGKYAPRPCAMLETQLDLLAYAEPYTSDFI